MDKAWHKSVRSDSFWIRTIFMLLFFIVYRVLDIVVLVATIAQWLFVLITGDSNPRLLRFSQGLAIYLQQIVAFLTQVSEQKPYPFDDWPVALRDEPSLAVDNDD
jgi:hypothetical protein